MSAGGERGVRLEIGTIVVPAGHDATDLAARVEREIAERRFGPGRDPLAAAIAARITAALDAAEDLR
jgi:hypothetical protein